MTEFTDVAAAARVVPIPTRPRLATAAPALADIRPEIETDTRYRDLIGRSAWMLLPAEVRRRFSKRKEPGEAVVYRGEVVATELSRTGWLLANLARLAGAPLPYTRGAIGAAVVTVIDEPTLNGQIWTRSYRRPGRFPQVIHSAKRFRGPTGLEEHLGFGLVMRLSVGVEANELVFRSAGYVVDIAGLTIPLPRWLSPGTCEVRHRAETDRRFSFTLTLDHPMLGRLLRQVAFFDDAMAVVPGSAAAH